VLATLKMAEIIELESALAAWSKQAHANNISIESISIRENAFKFLVWK